MENEIIVKKNDLIQIRVEGSLKVEAERHAKREHISMSELIRIALRAYLAPAQRARHGR